MNFYAKGRVAEVVVATLAAFAAQVAFGAQLTSNSLTETSTAAPATSSQSTLSESDRNPFLSKFNFKNAKIFLQAGAFNASQGNAQNVNISGLIGDYYTVESQHAENVLLGLGYYIDGFNKDKLNVMYGLDAFYFGPTTVKGDVIQEQLFTNLSYSYSLTNYPIYVATKAFLKNSDKYNVTFDLGAGPNIIRTKNFNENSLDGGVTLPDNAFSGQTSVAFSATAGVGIQFNNVFGHVPLECAYRFFYLGEGKLNTVNDQITSTLNTGYNYANALIFSVAL